MKRTIFAIAVSCATILTSAYAKDFSGLKPGLYQAGKDGCAHPSGVGTFVFDGKNFSGNHQICHTKRIDGKNRYRTLCMDTMGGGKSEATFASDPDKESFDLTIKKTGSKSFTVNGEEYFFCEKL